MNDEQMKKHIKETFEQDVPDVLSKIKASPKFHVPEKQRLWSWSMSSKRIALSLTSIFVIAIVLIVGIRQLNEPVVASTVTMEINPSIQITLDQDDHVIAVTAINDDGEEIIQRNIRYRGLTIDQLIPILINRFEALGYIVDTTDESNIILIEVDSENSSIQNRVEETFRSGLENEMSRFRAEYWVLNARNIMLTQQQQDALNQDSRVGPYTRARVALIYRIITLDDSYTVEQLLPLTVRQLYGLYIQLEDPDNLPDYDRMPQHSHHPGMAPFLPEDIVVLSS